jgi:hypothetical protein
MNYSKQGYPRDVTFSCDNLTLWEGMFLKAVAEAISKGKQITIESDEDFEKKMKNDERLYT